MITSLLHKIPLWELPTIHNNFCKLFQLGIFTSTNTLKTINFIFLESNLFFKKIFWLGIDIAMANFKLFVKMGKTMLQNLVTC